MRDSYRIEKKQHAKNPFLSIITRCMTGKRAMASFYHEESVKQQNCQDFEEIFIFDDVGFGMLAANTSLTYVSNDISGKMVFLLDDDDRLTNWAFVEKLKMIYDASSPDVIMFRNTIRLGRWPEDKYPTANVWKKWPMATQIGGSCFAVSTALYKKYIEHFARQSMGDFHFINAIFEGEKNLNVYWHDEIFAETIYKGKGRPELAVTQSKI